LRPPLVLAAALALIAACAAPAARALDDGMRHAARASGTPDIPGLKVVWFARLGEPAQARRWQHIIVHQTEGPAGSARRGATEQAKSPTRRGVMIWVETDGTVYWATGESQVPTHGDGANRNDNKYIDNAPTYRKVIGANSIGVEFAGNYPDVAAPASAAQRTAWLILARFLRLRYGIAGTQIYAHNWIDYKDARYCEGCALADLARVAAAREVRALPAAPAHNPLAP